jgi:hypothetical protein
MPQEEIARLWSGWTRGLGVPAARHRSLALWPCVGMSGSLFPRTWKAFFKMVTPSSPVFPRTFDLYGGLSHTEGGFAASLCCTQDCAMKPMVSLGCLKSGGRGTLVEVPPEVGPALKSCRPRLGLCHRIRAVLNMGVFQTALSLSLSVSLF